LLVAGLPGVAEGEAWLIVGAKYKSRFIGELKAFITKTRNYENTKKRKSFALRVH